MNAKFTFKLVAESGYEAEGEYKITPEQYGQIMKVLNGAAPSVSEQPAAQRDGKDALAQAAIEMLVAITKKDAVALERIASTVADLVKPNEEESK